MKIFVVGMSHCGSVYASCLSELNHRVVGYDEKKDVIKKIKNAIPPLYEPGLKNLIKKNIKNKRLTFTSNLKKINSSNIIWIAMDTPVLENDEANTEKSLTIIKKILKKTNSKKYIIISSQLPVGSIKELELFSKNKLRKSFNFFYCPENLRVGNAIKSFFSSARLVVGYRKNDSKKNLEKFFKSITKNIVWMKIESAEITKHAINSFLANSVSFINEISAICEKTNANAREVEMGLKTEPRIGKKAFLSPGLPFSGGTLGRDVNYLNQVSKKFNIKSPLISSIKVSNENHKNWIYEILQDLILGKKLKRVVIWGFSYTANTNTLQRSFGIEISKWLIKQKVKVFGYDYKIKSLPKFIGKMKKPTSKIPNCDALIILNNSVEFQDIPAHKIKKLNKKIFIIDPNYVCSNLEKLYKNNYISVGKTKLKNLNKHSKINSNYNLKQKSVIITGASKGLGFEIAKKFVKSGANVMICSRNLNEIKKSYNKLNLIKKNNQKIIYSTTDISSYHQVKILVRKTLNKFKKIDILVNNAGVYGPKGNIENIDWNEWEKTIKINLLGSIMLCREIIPHFKKNNKGKIIQLSGGGASSPLPSISGYAVSKAGIVRFVENLSEEIKKFNIDINAVAPGPLNTGMLEEILKAGPNKVGKNFYNKSLIQKRTGGTPFNIVCELILFLASKESDGITGKLISALWDNWKNWPNYKKKLRDTDLYTLRRITGKDRGLNWGDK